MSIKKKYSKPFGDLNTLKTSFFENNDGMLDMADGMADVLLMQPKRTVCKICGAKLGRPLYHSHRIGYIECPECGHLNSECEDTDDFASKVYVEDDYSKNYSMKDKESYDRRMNMIYVPKARFLIDSLKKDGVEEIKDLDICNDSNYWAFPGDIESIEAGMYPVLVKSNGSNTLAMARHCGELILRERQLIGIPTK